MPVREYSCTYCGKTTEEFYQNFDYPQTIECECGETACFKFSSFAYSFAFREGYDWGAGENFGTDRERQNYLAENGLRQINRPPKGNNGKKGK